MATSHLVTLAVLDNCPEIPVTWLPAFLLPAVLAAAIVVRFVIRIRAGWGAFKASSAHVALLLQAAVSGWIGGLATFMTIHLQRLEDLPAAISGVAQLAIGAGALVSSILAVRMHNKRAVAGLSDSESDLLVQLVSAGRPAEAAAFGRAALRTKSGDFCLTLNTAVALRELWRLDEARSMVDSLDSGQLSPSQADLLSRERGRQRLQTNQRHFLGFWAIVGLAFLELSICREMFSLSWDLNPVRMLAAVALAAGVAAMLALFPLLRLAQRWSSASVVKAVLDRLERAGKLEELEAVRSAGRS